MTSRLPLGNSQLPQKQTASMLSASEFFECELLTVSREQAELAASEVSGCEACSESAEVPFDWFLADAMNRPGMFEFVMDAPVKCPLCRGPVSEKTLVDRDGIEVSA